MPAARRVAANDPFTADWANGLRRDIDAARIVSDGSIHVTHKPTKQVLKVNLPQEADFKITSGGASGKYGGTEQRPAAAGAWADLSGGRTPTTTVDPLYERNLSTAVAIDGTVVVRARRNSSGAWIFQRGTCS